MTLHLSHFQLTTIDELPEFISEEQASFFISNDVFKNKKKLIRLIPIKSCESDAEYEYFQVRYYWDGTQYVRRFPDWHPESNLSFKWIEDSGCYAVVNKADLKYYVYMSFEEVENGRKYIGSRTVYPFQNFEEDDYYGSFIDSTFKPTNKVILEECDTRETAYQREGEIMESLNACSSSNYANRCLPEQYKKLLGN